MKSSDMKTEAGVDCELEQEHLLLEVTEIIAELMAAQGVTKAELARRLRTTKGHVTQMLSGSRNLTLRTLSDVFTALGYRFLAGSMPLTLSYDQYLHGRRPGGRWEPPTAADPPTLKRQGKTVTATTARPEARRRAGAA